MSVWLAGVCCRCRSNRRGWRRPGHRLRWGSADEGFDTSTDAANCGACGVAFDFATDGTPGDVATACEAVSGPAVKPGLAATPDGTVALCYVTHAPAYDAWCGRYGLLPGSGVGGIRP
ncbi:MAG: hypothetical protein V2A73_01195 [Pseudomonadota bacterium]